MTNPQITSPAARAWDRYDAYLFDIDGTLLRCDDAVHYFAFCEALTRIAGTPLNLDGVVTHGNVDVGILRDAFAVAGIPEDTWRFRRAEMLDLMAQQVERDEADLRITVLPGVPEVLAHLQSRGAILGVATGNLQRIGQLKLAHCGLAPSFAFGGYSDACEYRHEVFRAALQQAHALAGPDAAVCVVGDTPEDIRAARAIGADVIAVATGIFSYHVLEAEHPDWCLHSLTDLLPATS